MEIISLTSKNFQQTVAAAALALQKGSVVVAPTDTVYGLLANAANENAVNKLYLIKKRGLDKPLPIFVKNMAMAKKIAKLSQKQQKTLEEKWPGKTTFVFNQNNGLKIFGTDRKTVALRIPFNSFINSLLETFNLPLTGTSANISGRPASTKIDDVLGQFAGEKLKPDLVINAGDLPDSKPSTIVDQTGPEPKIIRA
jgi:tRNA threonylcarbamoyl adenosine modification protein (Sua5/YciO/YrdC/YwlC family)